MKNTWILEMINVNRSANCINEPMYTRDDAICQRLRNALVFYERRRQFKGIKSSAECYFGGMSPHETIFDLTKINIPVDIYIFIYIYIYIYICIIINMNWCGDNLY